MYLRRKVDQQLENWFNKKNHTPALIVGVRQCGKTESIRNFSNKYFKNVVEINFWKNPDAKEAFAGSLEVNEIIKKLSVYCPNDKFIPHETIIFLDEIQDAPNARLSLKSFKEDKRFEVIASGSHIGLNIDFSAGVPKPNGAEDVILMHTMDFKEFLWANGYDDSLIDELNSYLVNKISVPPVLHQKMKSLFNEYLCIGGYPEVVKIFIESNNYYESFKKNESLIFDIKGDPSKRKDEDGKPLYTPYEISRIQNAFDLIAAFSYKDNHRFVLSNIAGGNGIQKKDAILYLLNACVAFKVNNVTVPSLPLAFNKIEADFKLFYGDIGILTTLCGYDIFQNIITNSLGMSKGFLYEAAVADAFNKNDIPLYYFAKNTGLEVDFVISYQGFSTLIEVKAKDGRTKSSKTIMSNPDHYGITKLMKIGDYNVGYQNEVLTIPHYMTFLVNTNQI